jgi:hypothetical protein
MTDPVTNEAILRKAITDWLAGDYDNPRQHRPLYCRHGTIYYQLCLQCDEAHFQKALDDCEPVHEAA